MQQGTNAILAAHFAKQEEILSHIGNITYDLLHIIDYPPELESTFLKITDKFNATSGPFAIIEQEGRSTTEFYARCFNDVRMALCATWYNLHTFEGLCKELEERVEVTTKTHPIECQFEMNLGGGDQKLCFEYEHFMFHQKATVDRIAFFLSGFFKQQQDNIFTLSASVMRQYKHRADNPKQRYALVIGSAVSRHEGFLNLIHSSTQGRGKTERDILSHQNFIPFVNPYLQITPPGQVSVVFQATLDGRKVAPENARIILLQRYKQVEGFTKDVLDTFFDA